MSPSDIRRLSLSEHSEDDLKGLSLDEYSFDGGAGDATPVPDEPQWFVDEPQRPWLASWMRLRWCMPRRDDFEDDYDHSSLLLDQRHDMLPRFRGRPLVLTTIDSIPESVSSEPPAEPESTLEPAATTLPPRPALASRQSSVRSSMSSRPRRALDASPASPPRPPMPPLRVERLQSHHSAALSTISSKQQPVRARLDSNYTNSSKHRRQAHETFEFSVGSLNQIHSTETPHPRGQSVSSSWATLPMNEIECARLERDTSDLDLDDFGDDDDDESLLLSTDEEQSQASPSPTSVLDGKVAVLEAPPKWMLSWAGAKELPPTLTALTRTETTETELAMEDDPCCYLPPARRSHPHSALAAYMAFGVGEQLLQNVSNLDREDVYAVEMVAETNAVLVECRQCQLLEHSLRLDRDCHVRVVDVSPEVGRAVVVERQSLLWDDLGNRIPVRAQTVCTFLPVPDKLEGSTSMGEDGYAPDAQSDAVLHVMFTLDACLRQIQKQ